MTKRAIWILLAVPVVLLAIAAAALVLVFPTDRGSSPAIAPITAEETQATLAALKPPKRARPIIAVIGANEGTETTDYLVPYGILKRSGAADVWGLATKPGLMKMRPALSIVPDATTADFDRRVPEGADYVVVPALNDSNDAAAIAWIKMQASRGATIVGICDGVLVLANAGLLDGRKATGHWLTIGNTQAAHPTMQHVRDRRYVADRGLITTTGVSASLPVSLALVEAIAGREKADALARELGVQAWGRAHNSGAFHLIRADILAMAGNAIASLWAHETIGIRVAEGVDLIALSFTADAYARTFRTSVVPVAAADGPVKTDQGLQIVAMNERLNATDVALDLPSGNSGQALDLALAGINARYGRNTAEMIRLQLEYPSAH